MCKKIVLAMCLMTTNALGGSSIDDELDFSCPNPYLQNASHREHSGLPEFELYPVVTVLPFFVGIVTHVGLAKIFPKEKPFANEFVNRIMTPINAALALPVVAPVSSSLQQWWFSQVKPYRKETREKGSKLLEMRWHDTQASYGPNAQSMRAVYASITGRVSTNANRAKNAVASGEDKYAVEQIAEAAVSMRLLFAEIKPDDPLVSMTVHVQFTNHAKLDPGFAARVLQVVASFDGEYNQSLESQEYYRELLKVWLY